MRKNRAFALLAVLLLATTSFAAKGGYDGITEKGKSPITQPSREYNEVAFASIMIGMRQTPTFFCIPPGYSNHDPSCQVSGGMDVLLAKWTDILVPFYVVAMLFCALFFLLKSGTPRGRARARGMFLKLLFGMFLVTLAPVLYQILLETSFMLTRFFAGQYGTPTAPAYLNIGLTKLELTQSPFAGGTETQDDKENKVNDYLNKYGTDMTCIWPLLVTLVFVIAGVIMWLRNLMVFFYGVFFPAILFLYTFDITKPEGEKHLNGALKWIFVPPLQALILSFIIMTASSIPHLNFTGGVTEIIQNLISNALAGFVFLGGLMGFAFAPMLIGQLMSWLGNAIVAVGLGSGRQWMVSVGGMMAGGGSGAIIQSDAEWARESSMERYMSSMTSAPNLGPRSMPGSGGGFMATAGNTASGRGSPPGRTPGGGPTSGGRSGGQSRGGGRPGGVSARGGRGGGFFAFAGNDVQNMDGSMQSSGDGSAGPSSTGAGPSQGTSDYTPGNSTYGGYGSGKRSPDAVEGGPDSDEESKNQAGGPSPQGQAPSGISDDDLVQARSTPGQSGPLDEIKSLTRKQTGRIDEASSEDNMMRDSYMEQAQKSPAAGDTEEGKESETMMGAGGRMQSPSTGSSGRRRQATGGPTGGGEVDTSAEERAWDAIKDNENQAKAMEHATDSTNIPKMAVNESLAVRAKRAQLARMKAKQKSKKDGEAQDKQNDADNKQQ